MPRKHIAQNEVGRKPEYYQDRQRFHPSDPDRLVKLYERTGRRGSRTEHHVPLSALRRRSRTKVPGRAPLSKERAQVNERLTFLANMGCNGDRRRQNGRRMMAANLFAYLRRKEAVSKRNVRDWMVANVPGFDDDTENAVWLAFHKSVNYLPTPRELGDATGYTNQEWDDDGCPSFIWPIDIRDDAEILEILEKRRRKKAAIAKSDIREANGARPRNRSKAALARFYRVNVKTITRMLEDGRLHPDTGDRIDPATGEVLDVFVPTPKEASYRERTKTSHRTKPARKAPSKRQKDDMAIEDDTSAESADATRPIVAPGDDRPDDPELIPTRHKKPPAAPRTAPAADNNADAAGGPLRGHKLAAAERGPALRKAESRKMGVRIYLAKIGQNWLKVGVSFRVGSRFRKEKNHVVEILAVSERMPRKEAVALENKILSDYSHLADCPVPPLSGYGDGECIRYDEAAQSKIINLLTSASPAEPSTDKELPELGASTAGRKPERGADAPPPRGATLAGSTGKDGADHGADARPAGRKAGDGRADSRAVETAASGPDSAGNRHAVPTIAIGPDDDDAETNAELAAREFEKAAYRAERAAQGQSALPSGDRASHAGGRPTGAPRRPQGTLRHPAWGAGHQPSTGGRAPGNPPNQGSACRRPPVRVVYSGYNRGVGT